MSTDASPSLRGELAVSREAQLRLHGSQFSARELLEFATLGSARCLGRSGEIGQLTPGSAADVVVWNLAEIEVAQSPDQVLEAWLAAGPGAPRHTLIQGRFVVRDGRLVSPNYEETQRRHDAITADWQRFVDSR
jgi:cytosine/adenosine deaminase-related metal-dependent hydrolase